MHRSNQRYAQVGARQIIHDEPARQALALESLAATGLLPGPDRQEEDLRLAGALHLDLVAVARLDLHFVDLDLAQPDEVRELRRLPGAFLLAGGLDLETPLRMPLSARRNCATSGTPNFGAASACDSPPKTS